MEWGQRVWTLLEPSLRDTPGRDIESKKTAPKNRS
jgi:hypothetical protein